MTVCRLCLEERDLCKSHIIPELFFVPTYDEKHRALSPDAATGKKPFVQKGWTEKLLCNACESQLSVVEGRIKAAWYGRSVIPDHVEGEWLALTGLPYRDLKLLHLSVLWRASVAQTKHFRHVSLGPYEELRAIVMGGENVPEDRFPVCGFVLVNNYELGHVRHRMLMPHTVAWIDGVRTYCAQFGGCAFYYPSPVHGSSFPMEIALREDGTWLLPRLAETDFQPLQSYVQRWIRSRSARVKAN